MINTPGGSIVLLQLRGAGECALLHQPHPEIPRENPWGIPRETPKACKVEYINMAVRCAYVLFASVQNVPSVQNRVIRLSISKLQGTRASAAVEVGVEGKVKEGDEP